MPQRYLIPFTLILILLLAACGGQQAAEPSAAVSQPATSAGAVDESMEAMPEESSDTMETMGDEHDDAMDESAGDDSMEDMLEDDGDMAMESEHDETMDANAADGSMDDIHDDNSADMSAMDDSDMAMEGESEAMAAPAGDMMDLPSWQTLSLTNAATGESFTLGGFQGKTVFVEPMATWCSNCRTQQGNVVQAKSQLGDDVVFVGLSLETNLPPADLASYAQENGFDWTYAVMSPELLAGLADEFGRSITSAPSTPHFIIRPDGSYTGLSTGIDSVEEIIAKIQEAQS